MSYARRTAPCGSRTTATASGRSSSETGLGPEHLHRLFTSYRTKVACDEERCGQPQNGPGHPRRGWVQIRTGAERPWFCGLTCALRWLTSRLATERSAP